MIELLQKIGLSKYEAEAYVTLLTQGALTGYELGKRSQVPLSRSYEVLERLMQKHLALVQPGEPPRYIAEEPRLLFEQVRSEMAATLDALNASLDTLVRPVSSGEFWVVRGREHILARALDMIAQARETLAISITSDYNGAMMAALDGAQQRGCRIERNTPEHSGQEMLLLLADGREALVGLLAPAEHCQAVVSSNAALVTTLHAYVTQQHATITTAPVRQTARGERGEKSDWLAWEERKQRHLWSLNEEHRVA